MSLGARLCQAPARRLIQAGRARTRTTHTTVEANPRRLRPHSNQCCQQQFTHSLVIRHKLQLYPTSSTVPWLREASVALAFSALHSFILFSLSLDSIVLLKALVCPASAFVPTSSSLLNVPRIDPFPTNYKNVLPSLSYILLQVAFSQRSLTCRPEAKQNKTQDDASS